MTVDCGAPAHFFFKLQKIHFTQQHAPHSRIVNRAAPRRQTSVTSQSGIVNKQMAVTQ